MALIGMAEAAARGKMTLDGMRTALRNAGVPLVRITARAIAVEEDNLAAFLATRPSDYQKGRPPGARNKMKDRMTADELKANGFKHLPDGRVKHERYTSYRGQCKICQDWLKQLINGECLRCIQRTEQPIGRPPGAKNKKKP